MITRLRKKENHIITLTPFQAERYREIERARENWQLRAEKIADAKSCDVYIQTVDGKTLFRAYPR